MTSKKKATISGGWIDTMVENVGNHITLETTDGVVREGRMTGLSSQSLLWDGSPVEILTEVELNGDPYDTVPINRIKSIELI